MSDLVDSNSTDEPDEVQRLIDAGDAIGALSALLRASGARVTFDPERSIAKPCIVCGTTEQPRDLVQIGTFTRPLGGHIPGDPITRPMCAACEEMTRPGAMEKAEPSGGTER